MENFEDIKQKLTVHLNTLQGKVALKVKYLKTQQVFEYNVYEQLWSASTIKVALAVKCFDKAKKGHIDLDIKTKINIQNYVLGAGIVKLLNRDNLYSYRDLITYMLVVSDNTATNELVDFLGWESIEPFIHNLGMKDTTFRHKMEIKAGRGPNLTTANDMTILLELLYQNKLANSAEILEIMNEQLDRTKIPLLIPNDIKIPRKYGNLTEAMHEIGIVYGENPFIFCFFSDVQKDKRYTNEVLSKCAKICFDNSNF